MTEKQYLQAIGKNITKYRKLKKVTSNDLGIECDIEKSNMIRLEKGRTNPTATTLLRVAKALDIDVKKLFEF